MSTAASSVGSTTQITSLLEKMSSNDKDFRFMATSDLMNDLQKESIKLDDDSERRIVKGVLKLLEDANGEVQNQAVKCLGPLVCKVKEPQIEIVCDTLCTNVFSTGEQLRDISSIGLKTVISALAAFPNATSAGNISKKIMQRLLSAVQETPSAGGGALMANNNNRAATGKKGGGGSTTTSTSNSNEATANAGQTQLEILDIISDMLSRFGPTLISFHQQLKTILLTHLHSDRSPVRKRVTTSLSYLLSSCTPQLFNEVLTVLLDELKKKPSTTSNKKPASSALINNKTYVQALTSICRLASQRLAEHMNELVPITLSFIKNVPTADDAAQDQQHDELIEYCLQALETYLKRCPKETDEYVPAIINICLQYLEYDPNYNPGDEEQMGDDQNGAEEEDDNGDDDQDQDSFSDDDDMSWKVRRAAAKCIEAVVVTHQDTLHTEATYRKIVSALIKRFSEREDAVKADIFHCFVTILQQTKVAHTHHHSHHSHGSSSAITSMFLAAPINREDSMETDTHDVPSTPLSPSLAHDRTPLREYVPTIVRALAKVLKDRDTKNREGALVVLTQLVNVHKNILTDHLDIIIPNTLYSLSSSSSSSSTASSKVRKSSSSTSTTTTTTTTASDPTATKSLHSNLKIIALTFLHALLQSHDDLPRLTKHVKTMLPAIITHANDAFYKIAAEALLVLQQLVKLIRPSPPSAIKDEFKPFVSNIYECTSKRLSLAHDQEVKERAITCFAYVISFLGDLLPKEQLEACWPTLIERLKNEITRLPSVRAFTRIVESPLHLDLQPVLAQTVPILAAYLRNRHRTLRMNTLACLTSIVFKYPKLLTPDLVKAIQVELPALITENELLLSQYALKLMTSLCTAKLAVDKKEVQRTLQCVLELVLSPLLQGAALESVIDFIRALVPTSMTYKDLVQLLIKPVYSQPSTSPSPAAASAANAFATTSTGAIDSSQQQQQALVVHKQAFYSIAKSFAALTADNLNESTHFIKKFSDDLHSARTTDSVKILTLLCLGETGKYTDLGQSSLQQILLDTFSSSSEELRNAASYALGYIGIRNLNVHIPFLLREIEQSQTKRQYLLLHSLREIISYSSSQQQKLNSESSSSSLISSNGQDDVTSSSSSSQSSVEVTPHVDVLPHVDVIWKTLFAHCECPEEGTRNVVAECLGKLTLLEPEKLLPRLKQAFVENRQKPFVRSTIISAIKFTIVDQPQRIDPLLAKEIRVFFDGLEDDDIDVRRVALVMFNSAAHNKPMLIRDLLKELLPKLYNETEVRKDLIREVEMGPFRHIVDDGIDLRKSAFECMFSLLDTCLDKLTMFDYLSRVEDGLGQDNYDIRMLTFLMVVRLSHLCPTIVLQRIDRLVLRLKTILDAKVKSNAIKQEIEKNDELRRAALKTFLALQQIKDADKQQSVIDFLGSAMKDSKDVYDFLMNEQQAGGSLNVNNNAATTAESMDVS